MPEQVTIHSRTRVRRPIAPGAFEEQLAVTYFAPGLGPRIVYVSPADAPKDVIARVIAADLAVARAQKPETLELP